jgi:activator of HSP90 ATPase
MKKQGEILIREKLGEYIRLLKEEFSQGLILPTKNSVITNSKPTPTKLTNTISNTPISTNKSTIVETSEIKIQDTFKCAKKELFITFCDINKVKAFTQNSVSQYDCKKGGFFSLFSDNITGRFLDIVPYDRIDMLWRFKSWPSDHYSHVSLLFHDDNDQTKIIIQQTFLFGKY